MDITLTSDSLKASLKTLLLVASTSPGDGPASEIRLTAKSGSVVAEAVNKLGTQWMRLRLEAEVAADGSVCVPASSFSKVVSLLASPQVRLLAEEGKVKVKTAAGGRSGEQALVGMPAENWGSGRKAAKNAVALKINTQVLLDLPKHTSFSCSKNRTKAPLTAINAFCGSGWLRCTSCDQVRVSQFDAPDSSEGDGSFMLPVPAAAVLGAALRGTDPDAMVDVRVDPGHVDFEGESFRLSFTQEKGAGRYPDVRSHFDNPTSVFHYEVDLAELRRIVGLAEAVAPKAACSLTFEKSGEITVAAEAEGNRSRETILPLAKHGGPLGVEESISVACADLLEALAIPKSASLRMGILAPKNELAGHVLELIEGEDGTVWRHEILRAREIEE